MDIERCRIYEKHRYMRYAGEGWGSIWGGNAFIGLFKYRRPLVLSYWPRSITQSKMVELVVVRVLV